MIRRRLCLALGTVLAAVAAVVPADPPVSDPFVFRDVGDEAGLYPGVAGIRGHGVAWGDIDGSGFPSLFVASFHDAGSKPGIGRSSSS